MTLIFDERARQRLSEENPLFQFSQITGNEKPRNLQVERCSKAFARKYISSYHYSQTFPDSTMEAFAGWYSNTLAGICVFGAGSTKYQYTRLIPNIKDGEYRELTRLWSPDELPRNTESRLIMQSIKQLHKCVKLIVSFADTGQNHEGTVYKACNFYYCGITKGGKRLINKEGKEMRSNLVNIYRMRHPEYTSWTNREIMNHYQWEFIDATPKHRYVYLRGTKAEKKRMLKEIANHIAEFRPIKKGQHIAAPNS